MRTTLVCGAILLAIIGISGCVRDSSPPVQREPVPAPGRDTYQRDYEPNKPMPQDRPRESGPSISQ